MSYQGRSLDDLPLAAYSRGTVEEEPEEEEVVEQPHLSQQDAVAMAMGMAPAPRVEPEATSSGGDESRGLGLPRMSLPRFSLPKLPRIGLRSRPAVVAESPFHVSTQPAMAIAHVPAAPPPAVATTSMPAATSVKAGRRGSSLGDLSGLGTTLRNPRTAVREPRVLFGGMIAIGIALVGFSLLGGSNFAGTGPDASPTPPAGAVATAGPGAATVQVSGRVEALFTLTGSAGFGRPSGTDLASTWSDATSGTALSITGRVGSGTRITTADLVVSVTVLVEGAPVTFVSQAGECTVGMAEKVFNVTGSFVCPQVTSADGRVKLKITGSYQT